MEFVQPKEMRNKMVRIIAIQYTEANAEHVMLI